MDGNGLLLIPDTITFSPKGMEKNTTNIDQDRRSQVRYLKPGSPEQKADALTFR